MAVDIVGRQGDTQKSDRQVLVGRQLVLTGKWWSALSSVRTGQSLMAGY